MQVGGKNDLNWISQEI